MFTFRGNIRVPAIFAVLLLAFCLGCASPAPTEAAVSPAPVVLVSNTNPPSASPASTPEPALRYVFLFIGDGMGPAQVQAANEALLSAGREPLCFLNFPVIGTAHTNNAEGKVTDSAAAATAISTGQKTENGYLGLDSEGNRLTTIAEALRDEGFGIGILTTVSLDHATPAGFYAHVPSRRSYAMIADDLFASGFDFFAGGGFHETPDAEEYAAENGYSIIHSPKDVPDGSKSGLIVSSDLIFGDYGVLPAIDGGTRSGFLKDCTALSISRLSQKNRFFMMVEGGRIDYFCHYNDAASFVAELFDMNDAVSQAILFYRQHPNETLILVTADHETGSVSLSSGDRTALLKQTISSDICDDTLVAECVSAQTPFAEALPKFAAAFGLENLTAEETDFLKAAYGHTLKGDLSSSKSNEEYGVYEPITSACAKLVASRAGLSFGSGSHSSTPVSVYATGLGSEFFAGDYENTNLHDAILAALAAYPTK